MKYVVVLEKGESSYGAFVPDLPGRIAVGEGREQALRLIEEAVAFHIEGLRTDGLPVPPPQCDVAQVEVDAADHSPPRCASRRLSPTPPHRGTVRRDRVAVTEQQR